METVAYLHLAQTHESELENFDFKPLAGLKLVAKSAGFLGVAGTALASNLLISGPASACDSNCSVSYQPSYPSSSCYSSCQQPVSYQGCYNSCYQKQYYSQSYYPDYYYSTSYGSSSSNCGCSGSNGDYNGVSYEPGESNLLTVGSSGHLVALLQQSLLQAGFDPGAVDGVYGHQTADAVAQFQAANGLLVDGVAGGQTLDSLGLAGAGA